MPRRWPAPSPACSTTARSPPASATQRAVSPAPTFRGTPCSTGWKSFSPLRCVTRTDMGKHWNRLKRSLGRRWREWRLPRGYERLGTHYGGCWVDTRLVGPQPLLIDCGLGEDISFPVAFLQRFAAARVIGVDPNPRSLAYCRAHCPSGMEILANALWTTAGETIAFHLPRSQDQLPKGADGVSGSLDPSHEYV